MLVTCPHFTELGKFTKIMYVKCLALNYCFFLSLSNKVLPMTDEKASKPLSFLKRPELKLSAEEGKETAAERKDPSQCQRWASYLSFWRSAHRKAKKITKRAQWDKYYQEIDSIYMTTGILDSQCIYLFYSKGNRDSRSRYGLVAKRISQNQEKFLKMTSHVIKLGLRKTQHPEESVLGLSERHLRAKQCGCCCDADVKF